MSWPRRSAPSPCLVPSGSSVQEVSCPSLKSSGNTRHRGMRTTRDRNVTGSCPAGKSFNPILLIRKTCPHDGNRQRQRHRTLPVRGQIFHVQRRHGAISLASVSDILTPGRTHITGPSAVSHQALGTIARTMLPVVGMNSTSRRAHCPPRATSGRKTCLQRVDGT